MLSYVAIIPVFNHERRIETLVRDLIAQSLPCILVDDGSNALCAETLDRIAAEFTQQVRLVRHTVNRGKGAAVLTGFRAAHAAGFTHALQVDADGQHDVTDASLLVHLSRQNPSALVTGQPIFDESVPKVRLYMRYLTHAMVSINTLNGSLRDAMCGFRVYPIGATLDLADYSHIGHRMDFDIEVLVRFDWAGAPIVLQPTRVRYPVDGVSHFRMVRDNARITGMHIRLLFGMLVRAPRLIARRMRTKEVRAA